MIPSKIVLYQLILYLLASTATAELPTVWKPYDAVTYSCQRRYHQSVIKGNTLFIHGGVQTYNLPGQNTWTNSTLGYKMDPYLLQVDLRHWWNWHENISYVATEETADPDTDEKVRDAMHSGTMFHGRYNDTKIYTYGGSTFRGNESFPNKDTGFHYSEEHPLWSFDNDSEVWNSYANQFSPPSYGAAAEAPDQGLAFYLSGRTDNGTAPSTLQDGDSQTLLDGMMVIDMVQHMAKNISITGMTDNQPRIGSALQYAPGIGTNGILVALGGRVFDGKRKISSREKGRLLDFSTVDVFDINSYLKNSQSNGNGTWYSQRTSGTVPEPRIDFCTIITSAPDNSSHNIWVYGGQNPTTENGPTYYDDTHVLSLHSFTWIKMHQGYKPRWGHTCHLAGGNQMITVGGHNEFEDICDWHTTGVGVLNLYRAGWSPVFQASGNDNRLNFKIVNQIGRTQSGNATKREPEKRWDSAEFEGIMNKTRIYDNFSGTITAKGSDDSEASAKPELVITVAASVGAIVFIAAFTYLTFLYRRYRNPPSPVASPEPHNLEETDDSTCKFELPGEHGWCEANGSDGKHEYPGGSARAEADPGHSVTYAAEVPTTNFGMNGRWGIPVVRTRRPTLLGGSESESESTKGWTEGNDRVLLVKPVRTGGDVV
ncbi:hypothetical protein K458DRAFT_292990 [Lentithecium fluviatile CBS 122367]|uniref:Cell wall anchored protein n=1 Tax=Lentithecium fluviatile CBS 122367 TaxID=1168545 RepID=A0A6G1JE15_9PLEO|nr:hypothetical protein K458DRAFT_292990 [Lentithecium fluviatile CBS 122367]